MLLRKSTARLSFRILETLFALALGTYQKNEDYLVRRAAFSIPRVPYIGGNSTPCFEVDQWQHETANVQLIMLRGMAIKASVLVVEARMIQALTDVSDALRVRAQNVEEHEMASISELIVLYQRAVREHLIRGDLEVRLRRKVDKSGNVYWLASNFFDMMVTDAEVKRAFKKKTYKEAIQANKFLYVTMRLILQDGFDSKIDHFTKLTPRQQVLLQGTALHIMRKKRASVPIQSAYGVDESNEALSRTRLFKYLLSCFAEEQKASREARYHTISHIRSGPEVSQIVANLINGEAFISCGNDRYKLKSIHRRWSY